MKLTVVGGGSTYTPELVDGLIRLRGTLDVDELALVDPAADRLRLVAGLAERMLAKARHPARLLATDDLERAVAGSDAVLLQLRVGGQAARRVDETLPLACGCIGQETTGTGGLAKALRTVPVVLDIAARVAELVPEAWIVDFTNPVGIVTRALLDAGHRAVGLCNVAIGFQRFFAGLLDVAPDRITLDHVGLNHLTWERAVRLDGTDVLPDLLDRHLPVIAEHVALPAELLGRLGTVPSYYLRYFYAHDQVLAEQQHEIPRAEQVAAIERELLEMYADPALDSKPALLEQRGGAYYSEAAVALVASLLTGTPSEQVVNVRNGGTLAGLPDHAVVEVPATVDASGARPLPAESLEPQYAGLVAHVSAYEELALRAALEGGVDRVTDALLAHPLIGQEEPAVALARRLVDANAELLPWAVTA